jgi:hypothetical protein
MALTVEVDSKRVSVALDAAPKKTGIALLRALKRGTKSARTLGARVVAKDMGLKVGDVREKIRLEEPTVQTLSGELRASLKRVPVIKFGAKQTRRGVRRRGKGGVISGAFIAKMPTGHVGVFTRKAGASRRSPEGAELPIQQLYGPSIGHVFAKHRAEILARGQEVVEAELDRLAERIME